jgi:hypothetical protein
VGRVAAGAHDHVDAMSAAMRQILE